MKDKDADYISEFEELIKIKEFSQDSKMRTPFYCTYELIAKSLKDEYTENIDEKLKRWVDITHVMYFRNAKPVIYYFQAKMLYRDGFYEAAIVMSRSVCEMICYDLLSKTLHPFGDIDLIETPLFRTLVNFLAVPKTIDRSVFKDQIVAKINDLTDANFIKSSYEINKTENLCKFKIENGQRKSNLERLFRIFDSVDFTNIDSFKNDTHRYLHQVYDIGNIYVHAKKNLNSPREDATTCLNMLAHILSDVYVANESLLNKTIKSGYTDFPDICKGMNFALGFALTPEDAQRVYFNLPSQRQFDSLMKTVGMWSGEWKNEKGEVQNGILTFSSKQKDFLDANLKYKGTKSREKIEPMEIRLFGNYFHLIGFDKRDMKHRKNKHIFFELELFNDKLLIGQNVEYQGKVIFQRIE